jgi:hypothetical protein
MNDRMLSLSKEARDRHPYRSLYAALLLQSFQDALAEATMSNDPSGNDDGTAALPELSTSTDSLSSMSRV